MLSCGLLPLLASGSSLLEFDCEDSCSVAPLLLDRELLVGGLNATQYVCSWPFPFAVTSSSRALIQWLFPAAMRSSAVYKSKKNEHEKPTIESLPGLTSMVHLTCCDTWIFCGEPVDSIRAAVYIACKKIELSLIGRYYGSQCCPPTCVHSISKQLEP